VISVVQLLEPSEIERIRALLSDSPESAWQDGKETAGHLIKHLKSNRQMLSVPEEISKIFQTAVFRNGEISAITFPEELSLPIVSRYRDSDGYGYHVDNGRQGRGKRRDISLSLMLSDPRSYEGGELVFNFGSLRTGIKPEAGQAVLFPSQLEHCVNPVRGERLVIISWITSLIADPLHREIAYRLQHALEMIPSVTKGVAPNSPEREELVASLTFAKNNLVREWLAR
jgi:PKHD-type hydroxylase